MKTKPIAVFLTDTHKHKDNLDLVYDIFIQALELAQEMDCKYVIHGGDFFTDRIGQNLKNLLMLEEIISEFKNRGLYLLAIAGNHDKTQQESEESYLSIFKSKYFKLYKKQTLVELEGVKFGFVPYFSISMQERINELNSQISKGEKSILITHCSFNGVRNNDGTEVSEGISVKSVNRWSKVLVGHYHDASFLTPNVYYTGSAYQGNFGENHDDKGFHVIYNDCSLEFFPSKFKKFIKVKLSVDDNIEDTIDSYSDVDANIRFIFQGSKSDFTKLNTKKLDELGIDSKFEWFEINDEILKSASSDFGSMSKSSIFKHFLEYCNLSEIPKDKRSTGLKILKSS